MINGECDEAGVRKYQLQRKGETTGHLLLVPEERLFNLDTALRGYIAPHCAESVSELQRQIERLGGNPEPDRSEEPFAFGPSTSQR